MPKSTDYYEQNYESLIKHYNTANMNDLYKLFDQYIPRGSKVLDIGFGSGRDLKYLNNLGCDIWGVDPTNEFVENARNIFPLYKSNFFSSSLPNIICKETRDKRFDAIVVISVWMHLEYTEYEESIRNIKELLNNKAIVILSYSIGKREVRDNRKFIEVDTNLLFTLFKQYKLELIYKTTTDDSLNRSELTWETIVLKSLN